MSFDFESQLLRLRLPPDLSRIDGILELALEFFAVQLGVSNVTGLPHGFFRDWQLSFLSKPVSNRTGCILQLPPGAGKTVIAQWLMLEHLLLNPNDRVLFAAPLRTLAKQTADDVSRTLKVFDDFLLRQGLVEDPRRFRRHTVTLAEGPGARLDLASNTVAVATYEHAAGELRRPPDTEDPRGYNIGLVIVDEIHNIAKGDRGMVIDDLLYFSHLRARCGFKIGVLGMSGTLQDWMSQRLLNSYTQGGRRLFSKVYKPEDLGIDPSKAGLKAKRMYLDSFKFGFKESCYLARAIVRDLLAQRIRIEPTPQDGGRAPDGWRRAVFFFSTVSEAEAACVFVATDPEVQTAVQALREIQRQRVKDGVLMPSEEGTNEYYAAPPLRMVNTLKKLFGKGKLLAEQKTDPHGGLISKHTQGTALLQHLNRAGIYLHHAQLKGQLATDDQKSWQDVLQEQLGDPDRDFVAVFCTSTLSVGVNLNSTQIGLLGPNTQWTIDQAEQMIGRVGRVNRHAETSIVYVVESSKYTAPGCESLAAPSAWFVPRLVACMEFAGRHRQLLEGNLDVRGFFRPVGTPDSTTPDTPGGKALAVAQSWKLIEGGTVSPTALQALAICRQDLKSLPCTNYLLNLDSSDSIDMWLVCLWGLLVLRLPPKWCDQDVVRATLDGPDGMPVVLNRDSDAVRRLISLYGESHRLYPGDRGTPSASSVVDVAVFLHRFVWCTALYTQAWPYGDTVELFELAHSLRVLMQSCLEDAALLQAALGMSSLDRTVGSIRRLQQAFVDLESYLMLVENSLVFATTQLRRTRQVTPQGSRSASAHSSQSSQSDLAEDLASLLRQVDAQQARTARTQAGRPRREIPAVACRMLQEGFQIDDQTYRNWLEGLQEAAIALGF